MRAVLCCFVIGRRKMCLKRCVSRGFWQVQKESPACGRSGGAGKCSPGAFSDTRPSIPSFQSKKNTRPVETGRVFLSFPFKIDPYRKFFRNRSVIFGRWVDLSLALMGVTCDSGLSGGAVPCMQTRLCIMPWCKRFLVYDPVRLGIPHLL